MTKLKSAKPVLGVVIVAGVLLINFGFYFNWFSDLFAGGGSNVVASFRDAGQLYAGDDVRINGDVEGKVSSIRLLSDGEGSAVTLHLNGGAPTIYADASAKAKWRTLLGGSFYVALSPGTASTGQLGSAVIPMARTSTQVELDDVLGVLRRPQVNALRILPVQLAQTMSDPSVLSTPLTALTDASPWLASGLRAVQGEYPDTDLPAVIKNVAAVGEALDQPDRQLQGLVQGAAATLSTTGQRSEDIENTLGQGPAVVGAFKETLGSLNGTLTDADGLVRRLDRSADAVGPTLSALHPTLVSTAGLLDNARPLLASLRPAVNSLVQSSYVGVPLINALQPSLKRIDEVILPYLGKKDPGTGYSTTVMIGGTVAGFDGAASEIDQNGSYIRFPATASTSTVYLPCTSDLIDRDATSLLACDDLQTALSSYLSYLPAASSLTSTLTPSNPSK